jgi:hypothetical protein
VSKGTFHNDSDIDLFIVCRNFGTGYEFTTRMVDGIKVGYSRYSEEKLRYNVASVPYRMYIFGHAQILYDQIGISEMQRELLTFFADHQEVEREWNEYNARYEKEKKNFGEGKTSIRDVYAELDQKWSKELSQ